MSGFKTPSEIAEVLAKLYEKPFGGKNKGRFQISRVLLARIGGRKYIKDVTIDEVADILASEDYGFMLINLGDSVAMISESLIRSYRKVPKNVLIANFHLLSSREEEEESKEE